MKKIRLFMLLSLLMVCLSGIASAHDWAKVVSGATHDFYYSRGSAVRLNDNRQAGESGHIKAWTKTTYEDNRVVITQEEYKNVRGTIYSRYLDFVAYDYAGRIIEEDHSVDNWREVIHGSCGMVVYEYALGDARKRLS